MFLGWGWGEGTQRLLNWSFVWPTLWTDIAAPRRRLHSSAVGGEDYLPVYNKCGCRGGTLPLEGECVSSGTHRWSIAALFTAYWSHRSFRNSKSGLLQLSPPAEDHSWTTLSVITWVGAPCLIWKLDALLLIKGTKQNSDKTLLKKPRSPWDTEQSGLKKKNSQWVALMQRLWWCAGNPEPEWRWQEVMDSWQDRAVTWRRRSERT